MTSSWSPGSLLYAGKEVVESWLGVRRARRGRRVRGAPPVVVSPPASCSAVTSRAPEEFTAPLGVRPTPPMLPKLLRIPPLLILAHLKADMKATINAKIKTGICGRRVVTAVHQGKLQHTAYPNFCRCVTRIVGWLLLADSQPTPRRCSQCLARQEDRYKRDEAGRAPDALSCHGRWRAGKRPQRDILFVKFITEGVQHSGIHSPMGDVGHRTQNPRGCSGRDSANREVPSLRTHGRLVTRLHYRLLQSFNANS